MVEAAATGPEKITCAAGLIEVKAVRVCISGSRGGHKRSSLWPLWCHTSPGPVRYCGCFAPQPVIGGLRRHRAVLRLGRGLLPAPVTRLPAGVGRSPPRRAFSGAGRVHGWARLCGADGVRLNLRREEAKAGTRVLRAARRRFPGAGDPHAGSGEPAASSPDLMRECADGACTPSPGGRWRRPGPCTRAGRSDPRPARKQRFAVHQAAGDLHSPFPAKSGQPGGDGPRSLHAEGRARAETRAGMLVRPSGATFRRAFRKATGEGTSCRCPVRPSTASSRGGGE